MLKNRLSFSLRYVSATSVRPEEGAKGMVMALGNLKHGALGRPSRQEG
ncbi:hypothetical protein DSM110093_02875 [Sulfitobacter sp. DSM 110093]|nr:hypothetical protein DSM110093_02875 [Sulfitobacter sp. DSM 110093]